MDQTQVLQLRNVLFSFIGYLQQCLQRINVQFVSILVLLYRIRSFFHLILLSYFIDFVSFLTLQISSLLFVGFRFLTLQISFHFVGFRFLTLQISLDFVFVSFRFFSFLSLPVPQISSMYIGHEEDFNFISFNHFQSKCPLGTGP